MQNEKHEEFALLVYFGILLFVVSVNLWNSKSFFDVVYLVVILCGFLKFVLIKRNS